MKPPPQPPPSILLLLLTLIPIATSINYNNLCNTQERTSTIFKLITPTCVCFDIGIYEFHTQEPTKCLTAEDKKVEPPSPTTLYFPNTACVTLPKNTKAITRLDAIAKSKKPIHYTSYLSECHSNSVVLSRKKRQDPAAAPPAAPAADPAAAAPAGSPPAAAPPLADDGPPPTPPPPNMQTKLADKTDEDFMNTGTEVGHELMRNQMNLYIESVIAKLTGLQAEGGAEVAGGRKYPAIKLLEYTKQIMQKTCPVINADFFDLALNSFINLQLETYHIKEPYIGYSAYKRIEMAMTRCLTRAKPHTFISNNTNNSSKLPTGEQCDTHLTDRASNQTVKHAGTPDEEIVSITIPQYASSFIGGDVNKIAEPLIETVWKMLVSAHSYCYIYFSDYFNDHHTYTVSLLPLFTNRIQDIWLKGGGGYELGGDNKLYGGLLGNIGKIMADMDLCVGASRVQSIYPWWLSRPMVDRSNEWRRKKRDLPFNDYNEDPPPSSEEISSIQSRIFLQDNAFNHECSRDVTYKHVCQNY